MIYIGADHRGFALKEKLKAFLASQSHEVEDVGAFTFDQNDDYVDFAKLVAEKVAAAPTADKGILICGSGHGMDIVANKFKGVYAALCDTKESAVQSRQHGNTNVLVLAADALTEAKAQEIVTAWLDTPFSGEERHIRRLEKVKEFEDKNFSASGGSA